MSKIIFAKKNIVYLVFLILALFFVLIINLIFFYKENHVSVIIENLSVTTLNEDFVAQNSQDNQNLNNVLNGKFTLNEEIHIYSILKELNKSINVAQSEVEEWLSKCGAFENYNSENVNCKVTPFSKDKFGSV